ncbi:MAG: carbohydrate binding family 9 domain-containing protein [Spirosomataceae bacterium]
MTKYLSLLLLGWWLPFGVKAQDAQIFRPDSVKKTLEATKVNSFLKVDGQLSDAEWKLAKPVDQFIEIDPHQGQAPKQKTIARALFNHQFLYIGIICKDSLGKKSVRVIDFKRDFNTRTSDFVGMTFDGFNDQRNAMVFTTNPHGVQRDFLSFDATYIDLDWDGLWRVRTSRSDSGWVAEFAIPWKTLRYKHSTDSIQTWGYNINRGRRMTNENYALSPFPRSYSVLRMDYAGLLTGIQPPPPSTNVRVQPYFLMSFDRYRNIADRPDHEEHAKLGGEIKWAINSHSVLDLTFNTDFAQADADRQVNNVSRFSVFFPERRQFFLENASLFGVGVGPSTDLSGGTMRIQPFFSRQIGLDGAGNPIPLDVGARFVHRSLKSNYGGMLIRQREVGNSPTTHFFIGRFSQNFGEQNRIGGLITVKNNVLNTNVLGAIDGFFRIKQVHSLSYMMTVSHDTQGSTTGMAAAAQYYYSTNQWKIWWTQSVVTKNFNPAVGFVSRNDVIATTPGIFWYNRGKWIPFKKLIRSFEPSLLVELYHQASTGRLIERSVGLNPIWFMLQSGGFVGYITTPTYQYLVDDFLPLGVKIAKGDYHYTRHAIYYSTDGSKKVSFTWTGEYGNYYNGKLNTSDFRLQIAPIPHISINARFNRNNFVGVGENKVDKTVDLWSFEGRFALNPRLQLIGFYQKNTDSNANNYNIRLSWEYQPLSFIYLVFNKREFDNVKIPGTRSQEDHVIAKISYLRQL